MEESRFNSQAYLNTTFINVWSPTDALRIVRRSLDEGEGFAFFTMNLDHLVKLKRSAAFRETYGLAQYVSADGWPVVLMASTRATKLHRTTGADLVLPVCAMAAESGYPVFLFGSTDHVLAVAAAQLVGRNPDLQIAGLLSPPLGFDPYGEVAASAARAIARSGARICFVALGAPAQEDFAIAAQRICPEVGFLGIGASLDFLAGAQHRAPIVLQNLRLEWLWRWALSPRRLTRRYVDCLVILSEVAGERAVARSREALGAFVRRALRR